MMTWRLLCPPTVGSFTINPFNLNVIAFFSAVFRWFAQIARKQADHIWPPSFEIITRSFPKSRNFQMIPQKIETFPLNRRLWSIIENMISPDYVLY